MKYTFAILSGTLALALAGVGVEAPARAQFRQTIAHDPSRCTGGAVSAVLVTINGIQSSQGTLRVQSYRGIKEDWLRDGRWLNRIETPARAGTMRVCMPLRGPGVYAIAVRHDINGNGDTEITQDGGAMSNNPNINIWNLGRPSYKKTAFRVGNRVENITVNMRYM